MSVVKTEYHPECRNDEVCLGFFPAETYEHMRYTTKRSGNPSANGRVPIFVKKTELQQKGVSIEKRDGK